MPRHHQGGKQVAYKDEGLFSRVVEEGWLAFVILGLFLLGLRLYNIKQRSTQRTLLKQTIMAEVGYGVRPPPGVAMPSSSSHAASGLSKAEAEGVRHRS